MSASVKSLEPSQLKDAGKNVSGVGAIGGLLLAVHSRFVVGSEFFSGFEEILKVLVPFASVIIFTTSAWILEFFRMRNGEYYTTLSMLKKQIAECDKEIKNRSLTADQRAEFKEKRHRLKVLQIDSMGPFKTD